MILFFKGLDLFSPTFSSAATIHLSEKQYRTAALDRNWISPAVIPCSAPFSCNPLYLCREFNTKYGRIMPSQCYLLCM